MDPKPAPWKNQKQASGSSETNLHYCEVCQVPCLSLERHCAGIKHKKNEKDLQERRSPILTPEPIPVKPQPSKIIRSLRDYMKDPDRKEPLIGLEYLIEIRIQGKQFPFYECQLCQFTTELTPMIQHLIGRKHRNYYLQKHHPDKATKPPKEDKNVFLRRMAREVEKTEGLKMYKCEGFERPGKSSKQKARFAKNQKPENDPVRKLKALEYLEKFEIKSDKEASIVINLAQLLSEDLKAYCQKQATINHIKSLPSLLSPEIGNVNQHTATSQFESYINHPGESWNPGCSTNDFTQLQSLQQPAPSTSSTPASSYAYQMSEKVSSHGLSCQDLATVSAPENSFAHQSSGYGTGIDWMKQSNQSASAYSQSAPVKEKSPFFSTSQSSYRKHYQEGRQVSSNEKTVSKPRTWERVRNTYDSRARSLSPTLHHPSGRSQASFPSQKYASHYHDVLESGNRMPARSLSSEKIGPYELQQPYSKPGLDLGSHSSFSTGGQYEQQNTRTYDEICGSRNVLTDDILSLLRGKDAATVANMLQQLLPICPGLQNVDIYEVAQALSKMN
nr:uncharacterized protein LOC132778493 isoform X1 [Anolis sagrei ordinatus]XP_060637483.1 uncharacterized protein LOC132778493 isoform X1 [Anolis sagrei ordinatus]XP_060637484.1 uncharacterized protein LOC132778493 isoform X1 [Anolis sagrei ordinatus]XP_060637485.1 uncharacterized protein LOC132778493 isoform X1 [Anolis sagrei ordinatus]